MTRVLLTYPDIKQGNYHCPPTGMLYLHAMLRHHNIESEWVDGNIVGFQGVLEKIDQYGPDIVGVSALTLGRHRALEILQYAKNKHGMFTIAGGAHANVMYEQVLRNYPWVDSCCVGGGEWTILELAQGKQFSAIPNFAWREGTNVYHTTARIEDNIDYPFPRWDMVPWQEYYTRNFGGPRLIWSRGCSWGNCIFCTVKGIWGPYKVRSVENMIAEIKWLFELGVGQKGWSWADDLFSGDLERTKALLRRMIEEKIRPDYFDVTTRIDCVDREFIELLREADCRELRLGIETAHPEAMKLYCKGVTRAQMDQVIGWCKELGQRVCGLMIYWGVRWKEFDPVSRQWAQDNLGGNVGSANELQIFPGTPLYRAMVDHGLMQDSFWLGHHHYGVYKGELDHLTPNDWAKYIKAARNVVS